MAKLTSAGPVHAVCENGVALCGRKPLEGGTWFTGHWITRKLEREGCLPCARITRWEEAEQPLIA